MYYESHSFVLYYGNAKENSNPDQKSAHAGISLRKFPGEGAALQVSSFKDKNFQSPLHYTLSLPDLHPHRSRSKAFTHHLKVLQILLFIFISYSTTLLILYYHNTIKNPFLFCNIFFLVTPGDLESWWQFFHFFILSFFPLPDSALG